MIALVLLAGCLQPTTTSAGCTDCHGGGWGAAPPAALGGLSDVTYVGVGAHEAHMLGTALGTPVACEECHLVPATLDAEGHVDTSWPAEVVWGELSTIGGVGRWDRAELTCANTYCHGATTPEWTDPDAQLGCASCHGFPPPPPHSPSSVCGDCHNPTAVGSAIDDPTTHLDGEITLGGPEPACSDCHGTPTTPAPPPDTNGSSDTSLASVGAHEVHVLGGGDGAVVACGDCHVVPVSMTDEGHVDAPPAEVVFSGRAVIGALSPVWNATARTCSDTYCHGPATPEWTVVDGSQIACGSCHGLPPPPPHPGSSACSNCHGGTVDSGGNIIDPDEHIDGGVN